MSTHDYYTGRAPVLTRESCINLQRILADGHRATGNDFAEVLAAGTAYHLTPRAPFAGVRVRSGDRVRICWNRSRSKSSCEVGCFAIVDEVCPFRGIRTGPLWFRSWIIVGKD